MELAKTAIHKEGLDREPLAAMRDLERSHSDGEEQTISEDHPGTDAAPEKVKDEKQAEPEGLASAELGNGVVKHGKRSSENAVTSDIDYQKSEGNRPANDQNGGNEQEPNTQLNDDDPTPSTDMSNPLHEYHDHPTASFTASKRSQDQSATVTGPSQDQAKGTQSNDKLKDSSEDQQHISNSSRSNGRDLVQDTLGETHATEDPWREHETPPLDLNYEALKHIASTCLSHGDCIDITILRRGGFHEIRVLLFEDGWSCIARFTRNYEMLCKTESELATIEYVRNHTSIPVPQIYFVNHNENHVVGAPFVLMERLEGQPLCNIWAGLTLEHKKSVIEQLAHVLGQLAELQFDSIGSLKADGTLGPLLSITEPGNAMDETSFRSTIDYFCAFLREDNAARTSAAREHYRAIQEELRSFMGENAGNPTLNAPYRLIHNDLDSQNILVTQEDKTLPPKISGIIDWDWSYTGPLYYLCEYPHDICDWDDAPENYDDNKVLRKHLVATLVDYFPEDSEERKHVKQCFREKSYILNCFHSLFMTRVWPESMEGTLVGQYLQNVRGAGAAWERLAYGGRFDWERDSDLSDSDMEDEESQTDDESINNEDSADNNGEDSSLDSGVNSGSRCGSEAGH